MAATSPLIVDFPWKKQVQRPKEISLDDSKEGTSENIEDTMDDDSIDAISDISTDSIQESPSNTKNSSKLQFKDPKSTRDYAAKVRKIERKIMLGLLTDSEEAKLRKSKFFSTRFEQLLSLSRTSKKSNLYKLVTGISLNEMMMSELQRKMDATGQALRKKLHLKATSLRAREKAIQDKIAAGTVSPNDVNNFLRDMYFIVKFGEDLLSLDHNSVYKADQLGVAEQSGDMICDYCQSTVEKNRFGQREELLICKDCGNKAHPSCLSYSPELVQQIRADDSWQCIDCKACVLCHGTGDPDTLLFCDACDKGYHMQCHTPKLDQMPSGKWACASCLSKGKTVATPVGSKQPIFIIEDDEKEVAKTSSTSSTTNVETKQKTDRSKSATVGLKPKSDTHVVANISTLTQQPVRPVLSVSQVATHSNVVYGAPPPRGIIYQQVASVSSPVVSGVASAHVPMQLPMNQGNLIPVNYVVPNGVADSTASAQPGGHVLGKGAQNDLSHILNPKITNMPDVRSTIREDVLRALAPDVADWNVKDVSYYFKNHGYLQESKLLEEQEIDGRAMLLMSRNDCLTGLRIKLGPALKIYHMHIHKLQKRTDFLG